MDLLCIFHVLWILLSFFRRQHIFHSYLLTLTICTWTYALNFDITSPIKEEFLLKSHKVIEAVPRTLHRASSPSLASYVESSDGASCRDTSGACSDRLGYEAIRTLHRQLDDDASGDIDVAESDEFLRDELQYENGYERHKEFHGNDKYISVDELWQSWKISEVHNWTTDVTVEWLVSSVELPEYEHNFRNNGVDGSCLPRLALNSNSYMSLELGIKDPIHRQKIALKAMDVVLFGPPRYHNYLKDALLALSLIIAVGGVWFAFIQHKYSQIHMQKMMKDMEVLQKAEEALLDLQQELNRARQAQEIVNIEKQDLERRLQDEITISKQHHLLQLQDSASLDGNEQIRVLELEEQLRNAKNNLHEAEKRLESRSWLAPPSLQSWLQLTHELELRNYNAKKAVAEEQLQAAKEGCEKLSRKRSTFMGAFRIAHGSSIDDVDDRIIQAKAGLCDVTSDLQERMHRWKQVELLCGFPIVHNPGMSYLQSLLKPPTMNGISGSLHSGVTSLVCSNSEGTIVHDESPPPYAAGTSAGNLGNIAPPSYSIHTSSPSYVRKISTVTPEKHLYSPVNYAPTLRAISNTQRWDNFVYNDHLQILEVANEEDDQLFDLEDDCTERSMTPPSCSSHSGHSDASRPQFLMGDSLTDHNLSGPAHATKGISGDGHKKSLDQHSTCSEPFTSEVLLLKSSNDKVSDIVKKISTGTLEKKKKPAKAIVEALRSSFSSSNLVNHDEASSESTSTSSENKPKKKKLFFPQLLRRKTKMM